MFLIESRSQLADFCLSTHFESVFSKIGEDFLQKMIGESAESFS